MTILNFYTTQHDYADTLALTELNLLLIQNHGHRALSSDSIAVATDRLRTSRCLRVSRYTRYLGKCAILTNIE